MFAASREASFMTRPPWPLRAELQRHSLGLRWVYDVVHFYRSSLSRGGKRIFEHVGLPLMYSAAFLLTRTLNDSAFGFHCFVCNGELVIKQSEEWVHDLQLLNG